MMWSRQILMVSQHTDSDADQHTDSPADQQTDFDDDQ
jgi:hypothetical protein